MGEWGNSERTEAINTALSRLPHDQRPVGIGFKLSHSPSHCIRCRATISLLELSSIANHYEQKEKRIVEAELTA